MSERVTVLMKNGEFAVNPKAAKRMDKEFLTWINVRLEDLNKSITGEVDGN